MKQILKWLEKICEKNEIDIATIDYKSLFDSKLTFGENKEIFLEYLKPILKVKEISDEEAKAQIQEEGEKVIKEWKAENPKNMIDSDKKEFIRDYLKMISLGHIKSLIIHGKTGLGKTFMVLNLAKEEKIDFVYRSGYTTPLSLYKFLYENRDKIVIFDDLEGLFNNEIAVSILKASLWEANGRRIVSYDTTSKKIDLIPRTFEFTGKLIVLTNRINGKKDEHFKALVSRTTNYELIFTYDELLKMANKIIDSRKLTESQKTAVRDIIKKHIDISSEFNYRTLDKIIEFVRFNEAKGEKLFLACNEKDENLALIVKLMESNLPLNEQIRHFIEQTGLSRRTYFNLKKIIISANGAKRVALTNPC